jgi:small-conductance mechanosensitive channel
MQMTLAILASAAALALLVVFLAALGRRSFVVRQLALPFYVAAATGAVWLFTLIAPAFNPEATASVLTWLVLLLGLVVVLRLAGLYLFDIHLAKKGMRLPPLLPAVTMTVVYLVTALVTLRASFPKLNVTPLLATSAVTSLVLGLALQPILSNFFAGLVISVEKPFRLNDWIRVGDSEGRVVAITWRTTHLRTRDNDNLVIPNGRMADERVLNYYYPHPLRMERIDVPIHYRTPPYRVRQVLTDCVAGVPGTVDKPTPEVFLLSFEASSILYELRVWIEDYANRPRIASELKMRIWEALHKEGIVIPYPIQTLEIAPRLRAREPVDVDDAGPRPARLYVAEGPQRGLTLPLTDEPVTVGRSRSCTLALTEPNASKEHFQVAWEEDGWVMKDLGSSFGTEVNGKPASSAALAPLASPSATR